MNWKEMVKGLELKDEERFFDLLKRTPCDLVIYLLKVQDKVDVPIHDYYKILMKKYEEENNQKFYKKVREFDYLLRDDRKRGRDWGDKR
jgi:hypothetical protein